MKHLLTIAIVLLSFSVLNAQKKKDIQSAEEMVVYNKSHNNDHYKGLIVTYNYEFTGADSHKESEIQRLAQESFHKVVKVEKVFDGKKYLLSIITEGTTENNPVYYNILYMYPSILKQKRRELILK